MVMFLDATLISAYVIIFLIVISGYIIRLDMRGVDKQGKSIGWLSGKIPARIISFIGFGAAIVWIIIFFVFPILRFCVSKILCL